MIFYILYQLLNKKYEVQHRLKTALISGTCIYSILVYFQFIGLFGLYIMNLDIVSLGYRLYSDREDPLLNIVFSKKDIDLKQTLEHTAENTVNHESVIQSY